MATIDLETLITDSAYHDYVYAYPHKTAWRPLDTPVNLQSAWEGEDLENLFFYIHIPFCEMRCGFCNLFTSVETKDRTFNQYLDTLQRQMDAYLSSIDQFTITNTAIGGGTPSVLPMHLLVKIFNLCNEKWGINFSDTNCSIETSPATISEEKAALFKESGIQRLSIGIQSFIESECSTLKRPQNHSTLVKALEIIGKQKFKVFNIDLIYGIPEQTTETFTRSIQHAIDLGANELYLYPLYVRQLTLLGTHNEEPQNRLDLYKAATIYLSNIGWTQKSMRCFQAPNRLVTSNEYQCQRDGMIGLGVGARSYTNKLHYSSDYAIKSKNIKDIIENWFTQSNSDLQNIDHGFYLNTEEQKRRYVILSLLGNDLNDHRYHEKFNTPLNLDFPELQKLTDAGFAQNTNGAWTLTEPGLQYSDAIGHWLFSKNVSQLMKSYEIK